MNGIIIKLTLHAYFTLNLFLKVALIKVLETPKHLQTCSLLYK